MFAVLPSVIVEYSCGRLGGVVDTVLVGDWSSFQCGTCGMLDGGSLPTYTEGVNAVNLCMGLGVTGLVWVYPSLLEGVISVWGETGVLGGARHDIEGELGSDISSFAMAAAAAVLSSN